MHFNYLIKNGTVVDGTGSKPVKSDIGIKNQTIDNLEKFYTKVGIACLRMYNIENWSLVWKKIKRMELTPNEISEYKLEFDDILVNRVNSMELVGKSALIPKNIEECVFESKNIRLRLKTEYIKPQLAHLWLLVASKHYFYNKSL